LESTSSFEIDCQSNHYFFTEASQGTSFLQKVIKTVKNHDFSPLAEEYDADYSTQKCIPQAQVKDFLATAVHEYFHIPSVYL
jgi:hypothetical protein